MRAGSGGDHRLDHISVRHRDDGLAGVGRDEIVHGIDRATLHFRERFAPRKSEPAGVTLHGMPFGKLPKLGQLLPGPVTEVALDDPLGLADSQLSSLRDRGGSLARSFHRGCVHRSDGLQQRYPSGGGFGLLDAFLGQVKIGCSAGERCAGRRGLAVTEQEDESGLRRFFLSCHGCAQRTLRSVGNPDQPAEFLARLEADVVACRVCPRLVEWREEIGQTKRAAYRDQDYWARAVPGFGDPDAHLLVVGLAPAAHGANRTGRMFTGDRSGDWLYRALWRAGYASQAESVDLDDGLELSGAWITSPVKCAPPANKPTTAERDACRPFFARELEALRNVKVIVVLGGFGYQVACQELGVSPRPKFGHGVEVALDDGRTLLCSYHVSQQNTFTGRLTEDMLDSIFSRARELGAG